MEKGAVLDRDMERDRVWWSMGKVQGIREAPEVQRKQNGATINATQFRTEYTNRNPRSSVT